jgi:hypothetical protein
MSGFGTMTWSSGSVYEGNLKHFDLAFIKVSIFLTKSVYKLQCNLECNPVMINCGILYTIDNIHDCVK